MSLFSASNLPDKSPLASCSKRHNARGTLGDSLQQGEIWFLLVWRAPLGHHTAPLVNNARELGHPTVLHPLALNHSWGAQGQKCGYWDRALKDTEWEWNSRLTENTLYWSLARWVSKISKVKSLQSNCFAKFSQMSHIVYNWYPDAFYECMPAHNQHTRFQWLQKKKIYQIEQMQQWSLYHRIFLKKEEKRSEIEYLYSI